MLKYYYNDEILPELPADVLAQYPYVMILYSQTNDRYDAMFSSTGFYAKTETNITDKNSVISKRWRSYADGEGGYSEWADQNNTEYYGWNVSSTWYIVWSNHDIPNGSVTATDIYFHGSEPVAKKSEINYQINETTLVLLANQARRLNGRTTEQLNTSQMLEILKSTHGILVRSTTIGKKVDVIRSRAISNDAVAELSFVTNVDEQVE